ncbi:hypothetical protein J7J90_02365, partial [Candidatus Micrarchaeota archaeon]|nr:hypothetical protein [Candidatus Micrarchaeota archaeon]
DINAKKDTESGADISADYNLVVTGSDTETEIAGKTHNIERLGLFPNMCSPESTSDLCINISGSMWATGYEDLTIGNTEIPCELYLGLPGECLVSLATCNTTHIIYKFTANRDITENDVTINTDDCPCASVTNIDPDPEIDYTKMVTIPLSSLDGCTFTVGVNDCLCTDTTFSPETDAEILENCTDNTFTAEITELSCNHVKVCVKDDETGSPVKDVDVTLHGTSYINMSIATGFTIAGITNETGCIEMPLSLGENITHVSVEGFASKDDYSPAFISRSSAECGEEHGCSTDFCNETITCCEGLTCINNTCTVLPTPPKNETTQPPSGANQTYPNITLGNKTLIIGCMLGDCDEQLKSGDNYDNSFINWDLKMRSGCAGLFVIRWGNFIFCDILWLILLLLASYDAWRVHERNKRKSKNGLVVTPIEKFGPLITWLIPMTIGYITFVWIGIIVALVMFAYITEKIDKEYKNKKNQTSSGKWFHQLNIKTENTQSNIKQPKPKKINKKVKK